MNVMSDTAKTTPRRVLERARDQGVHDKCIEADQQGACISCLLVIHESFEHFYGHASSAEEAMDMIVIDLLNDLESE